MSARPQLSSPCRGEVGAKRRVGGSRRKAPAKNLTRLARNLRHNMTDAERKLWSRLKQTQLEGLSFRRQHPIGKFIVDFWCSTVKLVVELDGGQHGKLENRIKDADRTRFLESRGITVLRFWNTDVMSNVDGVLATIRKNILDLQSLQQTPTLTLPPVGGGNLMEVDR